ncbi:hypothetical protein DL95DRAFT_467937 [Leptodontidium sp. 2 PMI_412]|nr:hypothetical protein DL95DRAFT_467937 [Leptodontidium sp. 2 PMI_412]
MESNENWARIVQCMWLCFQPWARWPLQDAVRARKNEFLERRAEIWDKLTVEGWNGAGRHVMHASQLWSEFLQETEGDYPGPTIEQIDAAEFCNTEECRHRYDPSEVMNFERDEDGKLVLRFGPRVERGSGDFNTRLRNRRLAMENTSSTSLPNPQHNDGNTSSTKRISVDRHPSAPSVERTTSTEHSDEDMSEATGDDSDEDIMDEMQRATEQHRNSSVDDEFSGAIERSRASYREEKELQEALRVSSRSA